MHTAKCFKAKTKTDKWLKEREARKLTQLKETYSL